jgi:hypothetical protein
LDVRGLSHRRREDRITPAHLVEGLSGLIALHRFARDRPVADAEARREVATLTEELVKLGASQG